MSEASAPNVEIDTSEMKVVQVRPTIWASIGAKINVGNYENRDISFGISGVPYDSTPEHVKNLMEKAVPTVQETVGYLALEMRRTLVEDFGK